MVMVFHLYPPGATSAVGRRLTSFASANWCGVDLFFVLSGFLITGILLDHRHSRTLLRSFYGRRILRIVPLYYTFLTLFLVALPAVLHHVDFHGAYPKPAVLADLVAHQRWFWAFASNVWMSRAGASLGMASYLGMLWSLSIEEQFYLVWPLVVLLFSRRGLALVCGALIAVAMVHRACLASAGDVLGGYYSTFARMDPLAAGALCAIGIRSDRVRALGARFAPSVALVLGAVALVVATWVPLFPFAPLVQIYAIPLFTATFAATLFGLVATPASHPLNRVFSLRPLRVLGHYSYALYVFLYPVHRAVLAYLPAPADWRPWLAPLITGLFTLGIAILTWRTIEQPMLSLKRFLPYERVPGGTAR